MSTPDSGPVDGVRRPPPQPPLVGCGTFVALVLVMLFVAGLAGFSWWYSAALGCPVGDARKAAHDRAADDLEVAAAHLPGVVAVEADFVAGPCYWYDSMTVDLTVEADADPEQVAAAVALVAAGLDGPGLRPSGTARASVHDDGPEHNPGGDRPSLHLQDRAAGDRAAALARAWAQLKGRYRSTHVGVGYRNASIRVQLPGTSGPAVVYEAFDMLRGLGLTEGTNTSEMTWEVVVAAPERVGAAPRTSYSVVGELPPADGLAAIEAVAGWSAALGPEVALESKAVWSKQEGEESPGLTVAAYVDVDAAGRTVEVMADDLVARLAGFGVPYHVEVVAMDRRGRAERTSG
jgi:hypothetical protein